MRLNIAILIATAAIMSPDTTALYADAATKPLSHYTNEAKTYSVDYPSDWQKKEIPNLDLFLFAPLKNALQKAPASINIISEKIAPDVTVDKFYNESIVNLVNELKDVKLEKTGDQTIGNAPAKWVQYSHKIMSIDFKVMQIFLVKDGRLYLITFSAPTDEFDGYKQDFDAVLASIKFT